MKLGMKVCSPLVVPTVRRALVIVVLSACGSGPTGNAPSTALPAPPPTRVAPDAGSPSASDAGAPAFPAVASLQDVVWADRIRGRDPEVEVNGVAYGELGDPGRAVAIVHLDVPSDKAERYEVYVLEGNQPLQVGALESHRSAEHVDTLVLRDRAMYTVRSVHANDDAECCPSQQRSERWVLGGTILIEDLDARKSTPAPKRSALACHADTALSIWRGTALLPLPRTTKQIRWEYRCSKPGIANVVVSRAPSDVQRRLDEVGLGDVRSCDDGSSCCTLRPRGKAYVDMVCFDGGFELIRVVEVNNDACHG